MRQQPQKTVKKKVGQNLLCILEQMPVPTTISLAVVLQSTSLTF